jgi:hypothetical protein
VLDGRASWEDVPAALVDEADFLRRFVAEQQVQTNEVRRSWVLAPLFLKVAQRTGAETLDLIELGPSAGLNLVWDRYRCVYEHGLLGPTHAPLTLGGDERGLVPGELLALRPSVRRRIGVDLAPIDVTSDEGARLLTCFVWADQRERIERLGAAIEALRGDPPELVQGDFVERLPELIARRPADGLTVVFQTAALGYVDDEGRTRVQAALDEAGAQAPLAFVSAGHPACEDEQAWGLRITCWPGGERELVGHADYHGAWLDWAP